MYRNQLLLFGITGFLLAFTACKAPSIVQKTENYELPASYNGSQDSTNTGKVSWKDFFADSYLNILIDTALSNNQELNIMLQEIQIAKNEVRERKGEYLPFVGFKGGAEVVKVGRYTRNGAVEATTDIKPGKEFPDPLPDYMAGLQATWELDVWKKLRNAKKAAVSRYLGSIEGRNFMVTNLISEIANSYYELLALDNELAIINQNIEIQDNALRIVKLQKEAAQATELAVKRFQAEVFSTRSLRFDTQQKITETENNINFLIGRLPQAIERNSKTFNNLVPKPIYAGLPSQLLQNRPDIRQAELELAASKLDIKVARAHFYPSLGISAGIGLQAFNPSYLTKTPESLLYNLVGDLTAPLINRNAIKATYYSANAKQLQAVYEYERTILNAYVEVVNQLSNLDNLQKSYNLKAQEVEALTESIKISNTLFRSARADYMEVLLTQRDALESKFELLETKVKQMNAFVNMYRALGGGWN
jgi:multidrug efflux system outer membrane protein